MKKLILVILALSGLMIGGCNSTSSQVAAYKTLKATEIAVKAAMNTYGELYRAGSIDAATEKRIDEKFADFQAKFAIALKAARFDYESATPTGLAILTSTLILEIEAL